jgi:hypothetical protein
MKTKSKATGASGTRVIIISQPTRRNVLELWAQLERQAQDRLWPMHLGDRVVVIMPARLRGRIGRIVGLDWGGGIETLGLPRLQPGKVRLALRGVWARPVFAQHDLLPASATLSPGKGGLGLRFAADGRLSIPAGLACSIASASVTPSPR